MTTDAHASRRGYPPGWLFGKSPAVTCHALDAQTPPAAAAAGPDSWIKEVKGTICLFDFPQHKAARPLLHILN